jgi:hypothetical protein
MNVPPVARILIHPETMLTVTLQYPGQPPEVNAIACRYIVGAIYSGPAPHRVIAIEVIHDPMRPVPAEPYECFASLLNIIRLPANALLHVRPYVPAPPGGQHPPPYGQLG